MSSHLYTQYCDYTAIGILSTIYVNYTYGGSKPCTVLHVYNDPSGFTRATVHYTHFIDPFFKCT